MNFMKQMPVYILMAIFCTNCSTAQKLQNTAPVTVGDVYSQKWVAGVEGGGSGINLFIPVSDIIHQNIQLDSVYFRGKVAKLETIDGKTVLFVARFKNTFNQKNDIVMSNDPKEEYGNKSPIRQTKIPFDLKDSEGVVSYKEANKTKYFKIGNITEKLPEHYPSAPQNKHE